MYDKENIIFDMPPGSDGFSSVVFNSMFKNSNTNEKSDYIGTEDDIRNLFFIINLDYGHIATVLRELKVFVQQYKMKFPDNIFIVINSTTSVDESRFTSYIWKRYKVLAQMIKDMQLGLSQSEYDSIHFIFTKFNPKYSDALCNGEGLSKAHLSAVFEDVINMEPSKFSYAPGESVKGVILAAYGLPNGSNSEGSELYDIMTKKR